VHFTAFGLNSTGLQAATLLSFPWACYLPVIAFLFKKYWRKRTAELLYVL